MSQVRRAVALVAAIACPAFVACKSHDQSATNDSVAGTAAPAAATPITDTAGAAAAMSDTAGKTVASAVPTTDAGILAKAHAGDSAEVAIAKYVAANTKSAGVRAYAHTLERDHGKGMSVVEGTAKKLNLTMQLPAGDTTAQETSSTLDRFKSLKGRDLDTAFVNHEIADHQTDINDARQMSSSAQSPEVKALLDKELPELHKHLDAAQKLSNQLSGVKTP